jgi:rhamnosyltransferase
LGGTDSIGRLIDPAKVAVIIPTLNAEKHLAAQLPALARQCLPPSAFLIVDSSSRDATREIYREFGAGVVQIDQASFNHGGTRRYAASLRPDAELVIMMTQDAIPASPDSFAKLLAAFADDEVGLAYGRQLPRPRSRAIERHARIVNYPEESATRVLADRKRLGVKTTFCSDSFAAYRRAALEQVGSFPEDALFAEDQVVAGRMLLNGWRIAYQAEATVIHSHEYSIGQDFTRYFDAGVFHSRNPWLIESFGRAEGEGLRFVKSELRYLAKEEPQSIPSALARTLAKYLGYRIGQMEAKLPLELKRKLSMQPFYWRDS